MTAMSPRTLSITRTVELLVMWSEGAVEAPLSGNMGGTGGVLLGITEGEEAEDA